MALLLSQGPRVSSLSLMPSGGVHSPSLDCAVVWVRGTSAGSIFQDLGTAKSLGPAPVYNALRVGGLRSAQEALRLSRVRARRRTREEGVVKSRKMHGHRRHRRRRSGLQTRVLNLLAKRVALACGLVSPKRSDRSAVNLSFPRDSTVDTRAPSIFMMCLNSNTSPSSSAEAAHE